VEQVVTEQATLGKVVVQAVQVKLQAFLANLPTTLLVVVVALMELGIAPTVLDVHCQLEQPVSEGLRSVEMVEGRPPIVAVMDMEIAVILQMARRVLQILEAAAAVRAIGNLAVLVRQES
jgi:hypothetical protein